MTRLSVVAMAVLFGSACLSTPHAMAGDGVARIRISDGAVVLTAELEHSVAAADFLSMLPLTLTAEDYAGKEKIAYLPRKLKPAVSSEGYAPAVGDVAYYGPWGNLALFYAGAPHANGLIRLGRLRPGNVESLRKLGPRLTIERDD